MNQESEMLNVVALISAMCSLAVFIDKMRYAWRYIQLKYKANNSRAILRWKWNECNDDRLFLRLMPQPNPNTLSTDIRMRSQKS